MNAEQIATRRVLALRCSQELDQPILESLSAAAQVKHTQSLEVAVEQISKGKYDLVLSDVSSFVSLEHALVARQAGAVFEAIGQSACVIDRNGHFVWCNQRFDNLRKEVVDKVAGGCRELLESLQGSGAGSEESPRRFLIRAGADEYYEVTVAPVQAPVVQQFAVVITDITAARHLQRKIDAIDRAGRTLVRLDAQEVTKLDFGQRLALLEDKIIRFTHDLMNFSNFAIYILDRKTNKLQLLVNSELPPERVEIELSAETVSNGICGYVAATGRSYICPDVLSDPRYLPGIDNARSSLTVPLLLHDEILGVLNVESEKSSAFVEDDRQFAEIFGRYIAMALHTFDLLATERVATTGKLASDVQSEIAAPLNDIITEATTLMEDYIGQDDLRDRLQSICDRVMTVKQSVKEVAAPTDGILGSARRAQKTTDPFLAGKKVLVADDEDAIRETVSDVLTNFGCDVETAHDGAEACAMLAERAYDVVLSDINMPHKSGYEVFAAAREICSCPVILMTGFGYDPNHSIVRARQEGLSAVLFKPFKVDQLLSELRNAMQVAAS